MAKYVMREMNDLNGTGERRTYPKIEQQGQVKLIDLARSISEASSFSVGDVIGVVQALRQRMIMELARGQSVKIEELGIFRVSLKLKKGKEVEIAGRKGRRNAQSIEVGGINFSPEKDLIKAVNTEFRPERSDKKGGRSSDKYTLEERLALAHKYLSSNPLIKVADYCKLTGLLSGAAAKELKAFSENVESGIDRIGRGKHIVYVFRSEK